LQNWASAAFTIGLAARTEIPESIMKVTAPSLVMGTCVKLLQGASKTMLDLDPA
jgi:hypothetical protein